MQWKRHLLASGAVLAAALATSAQAQTRPGASAAAAANTIEELVVTAEKREQNLQDVPVAVSAFTSEKRDLIGINTIADMTNFTPGLEYNAQNDRNTLRGVGRNTNVHAADGSVAQYSDGIYTSSTVEAGKTPLFVDRVEILRGPQGTLYGRNAIAGAINIISRRPTEDWYAEVRGQYQNFDHYILEAAASGPTPIPGVQFRIGANWERQTEGWFKNTVPGQPQEGNIIDTKYVEGQLKVKFNDRFDAWGKIAWADWHNDGGGPGSRDTWTPAPFPVYEFVNAAITPTSGYACFPGFTGVTNIVTPPGMSLAQACHNAAVDDPRKFTSDVPYQVKLTGTIIVASEWNYHFDNFDVKYLLGGTHYDYALTGPTPVDQAPILGFTYPSFVAGLAPATVRPRYAFTYHEALNWISHEINIASTDKGPFQWLVGGYYYDEHYVQPVSTQLMDQGAPVVAGPFFLPSVFCAQTNKQCPPLNGETRIYDDRPELTTQSRAVFGQVDWAFAPDWKVTLGLRYTKDKKFGSESLRLLCFDVASCTGGFGPEVIGNNLVDLTQLPSVVSGFVPGGPGAPGVTPGVSSLTTLDPATGFATRRYFNKWSATTGTAGIQWQPDSDTNAYFRYSRGYKAGGFRIGIDTVINPFPNTNPEHVDAFEAGIKKSFGRTVQANLAVFRYNYKNDQIPLSVAPTSGGLGQVQSIFFNIPEAISQGVELETTWQPIDHLQILFNYSYLDAHITRGDGVVDPADPAALAPGAKPDVSFAQCAAKTVPCSADVFTGPTAFMVQANGTIVPVSSIIGAGNGGFQRTQSIVGGHLPNAPKNKVAVNVNYTYELGSGSLVGSLSYVWRDKQFGSIFDRAYYQAPSWDQWDARLTYKDRDNRFTVIAFVKNIFNDLGYEGGAGAGRRAGFVPAYVLGLPGLTATPLLSAGNASNKGTTSAIATGYLLTPPRTYGIELQYRFF